MAAKGVPSLAHEAKMFDKLNHPDSGARRLANVYVGDFAAQKKKKKHKKEVGSSQSGMLKTLMANAEQHFDDFVAATERITSTNAKP